MTTDQKTRLLDVLDEALDGLALMVFNIGYKLRSQRIAHLNRFIPTADRLIR